MIQVVRTKFRYAERVRFLWNPASTGEESLWVRLRGVIDRVVTQPNLQRPPTANYDIVLTTTNGVDLLGALAMNRSATLSQIVWPAANVGGNDHAEVVCTGNEYRLGITNHGGSGVAGVIDLILMDLSAR